jgi:N-acetylglucosaminyldiphosphoundecaprenol N-acetyl-beta-D-mannosaminyltransferase
MAKSIRFCGVSFWNDRVESLVEDVFATGGDVLVPAAPAFAKILRDEPYYCALREGKYVIFDSGLMALLCLLLYRRPVSRISGLRLIEYLFLGGGRLSLQSANILWVVPNKEEPARIAMWLDKNNLPQTRHSYYVAPVYRQTADYSDAELMGQIDAERPKVIILCIGGGTQEKLAWHLKKMKGQCPPIFCTGAAISFFTGSQARIPRWVDRAYLGWFWRILEDPGRFGKRYAATLWDFPAMLAQYYQTHGKLK